MNKDAIIEQLTERWLDAISLKDLEQFYIEETTKYLKGLTEQEFKDVCTDWEVTE